MLTELIKNPLIMCGLCFIVGCLLAGFIIGNSK